MVLVIISMMKRNNKIKKKGAKERDLNPIRPRWAGLKK